MHLDDNIVHLITELEALIGSECYNPNSYDGWTGEEGCNYRYPVYYCKSKTDYELGQITKTRSIIKDIEPFGVKTIKYKFGSNHLYIGDGLVSVLNFLEGRYNLDFSKLESDVLEEKKRHEQEILCAEKPIEIVAGTYVIGKDIPSGVYNVFAHDSVSAKPFLVIVDSEGNIDAICVNNSQKRIDLRKAVKIIARDVVLMYKC